VVQLGDNGPPARGEFHELRRVLRDARRVVLVNVHVPRRWAGEVNHDLAEVAAAWPQARVADWHAAASRRNLLYDDATHPTPQGRRVYAQLVGDLLAR
jgi:hypothetical protein